MEIKTFSNPLYTAQRALEKRRRILKKLRVNRPQIQEVIDRAKENFVVIPKDVDEKTKKTLLKLLAAQKRGVEEMEAQLKTLGELEKAIGDAGFNINDRFNGIETCSTLTPAGSSVG